MAVISKTKKNNKKLTGTKKANTHKGGKLFKGYGVSREITQSGEYYAEVKEWHESETRNYIRVTPYLKISGSNVYYEDAYINLARVNSSSSAAGQFLTLFEEARHWGDVKDRIVGIEINLNEGRDGKVYKNVVRVFETTEDELIFDDEHMRYPVSISDSTIGKLSLDDTDEDSDEEDEDVLSEKPKSTKFSDDIFDEEDIEEDEEEEE